MRKANKQEKPITPQRFAWRTHTTTDTFVEADGIRKSLKDKHVKVHMPRGRFCVKIGEPVKAKAPEPAGE